MKTLTSVCVASAGALLLAVAAPAEDLTIVYKTTGQGGAGTSTQYFSAERMRTSDGDTDTIYEYSTGTMIHVDHSEKQYYSMTLDEMEAAMNAANAEMQKMSAEMENMPAAMRERMQKMMGGGGGEVTLTKGATREIAGYTTQEYTVTQGDSKIQTWTTTQLQPPVSLAQLRRLSTATSPMAAMGGNPMFKGIAQMADKMKEVQGFPLADSTTLSVMGRAMQSSREATEVRKGAIPAETFDLATVAPGYTRVDSPLAGMGER